MKAIAEQRRAPVEGARNLRDLGGYGTHDGRTVRRGAVLRGGHPGQLSDAGRTAFAALGLRAFVDLRSTSERDNLPFPADILAGARYWTREYDISNGDIVATLRHPATSPAQMRAQFIASYCKLPYEQGPGIAAMLRLLAEGETPLLINCTAGKDRTGVASAILLAALGVPQEQIIEDYALTEWLEDPAGHLFKIDPEGPYAFMLKIDPEVWRVLNRSDPDYIRATFVTLEAAHGSIEGFLDGALGIAPSTLVMLRERLLEA